MYPDDAEGFNQFTTPKSNPKNTNNEATITAVLSYPISTYH